MNCDWCGERVDFDRYVCSIKGCKEKGVLYATLKEKEYAICENHKFLLYLPLFSWSETDL